MCSMRYPSMGKMNTVCRWQGCDAFHLSKRQECVPVEVMQTPHTIPKPGKALQCILYTTNSGPRQNNHHNTNEDNCIGLHGFFPKAWLNCHIVFHVCWMETVQDPYKVPILASRQSKSKTGNWTRSTVSSFLSVFRISGDGWKIRINFNKLISPAEEKYFY